MYVAKRVCFRDYLRCYYNNFFFFFTYKPTYLRKYKNVLSFDFIVKYATEYILEWLSSVSKHH